MAPEPCACSPLGAVLWKITMPPHLRCPGSAGLQDGTQPPRHACQHFCTWLPAGVVQGAGKGLGAAGASPGSVVLSVWGGAWHQYCFYKLSRFFLRHLGPTDPDAGCWWPEGDSLGWEWKQSAGPCLCLLPCCAHWGPPCTQVTRASACMSSSSEGPWRRGPAACVSSPRVL